MEETKVNTYEISFLVNSADEAGLIKKHLNAAKAEVTNEGPVVQMRLAYPVKKQDSAHFGYFHFKLPTESVAGLDHEMTLDKSILRFLIVTPPVLKSKPREEFIRPAKRVVSVTDTSNQALEEKLAALKSEAGI